jgi:hypothetical protein
MQPQRHTLGDQSRPAGLARRSAPTLLAWIGLFVVVSTSAYGLQGAAAALAQTVSTPAQGVGMSQPAVADAALLDDAALERQGLPLDANSASWDR